MTVTARQQSLSQHMSVLMVASPVPSHPSTMLIWEAIASLGRSGLDSDIPIILAHDAPRPRADASTINRYHDYLEELQREVAGNSRFKVVVSEQWGHLSGAIRTGLSHVRTPLVLICQHDFVFAREINWRGLVYAFESDPQIKHLRFNKRNNLPTHWDGTPPERSRHFRERLISTPSGNIRITKTIAWSDNNHLTSTAYYSEVVGGLLGNRKTFPESPLNLIATSKTHPILGTYLYGGRGEPPSITHLDGSGDPAPCSPQANRSTSARSFANFARVRLQTVHDKVFLRLRLHIWLYRQRRHS